MRKFLLKDIFFKNLAILTGITHNDLHKYNTQISHATNNIKS